MRSRERRIPLSREELRVRKQRKSTGLTRVDVTTAKAEQTIDVPLEAEEVVIERVRVDRAVDAPEQIRTEGDVTVVPIHEEVITKQLVVKEELRIRKRVR